MGQRFETRLRAWVILTLGLSCSVLANVWAVEQMEEKLSGKVVSISLVPIDGNHPDGGVMLGLRTLNGLEQIHVGPSWMGKNQNLGINVGDQVMVLGISFRFGNKTQWSAKDLKKLEGGALTPSISVPMN